MSFVPVLGIFQLLVVLNLFPRAVDKLGLTPTGAIGCAIVAIGMTLMPYWPAPGFIFISM